MSRDTTFWDFERFIKSATTKINRAWVEWDDTADAYFFGVDCDGHEDFREDYEGYGPAIKNDTADEMADAVVAIAWHLGHNIDSADVSVYTDGDFYSEWIPPEGQRVQCPK
tara:strand:- start:9611 stop:9943 length:333 start_codon:yes stop_codon:yes gene_type:complete